MKAKKTNMNNRNTRVTAIKQHGQINGGIMKECLANRYDGGMTQRWINRVRYNWDNLTISKLHLV
jgi:hypothetical protein